MISWEPWPGRLEPIAAGERDDYVRRFASDAAAYEGPILLRFAHEMNLRGIPWHGPAGVFTSAWQRVRAMFRDSGASNVGFVWSPHVVDRNAVPFERYYPGHDQVDWVALDGYNWGRRRWRNRWASFDSIFSGSYRALVDLAPDKPMLLAEIGSAERGGDKGAWMRDALLRTIPEGYPDLLAVVWFDRYPPGHADWRLSSSPAALEAWRTVVADDRYSLTGRELLATAGVPIAN